MQQRWKLIALALGLLSTAYVTIEWQRPALAQAGRGGSASTTAAVPSDIGILDPTGPYEVVAGWHWSRSARGSRPGTRGSAPPAEPASRRDGPVAG